MRNLPGSSSAFLLADSTRPSRVRRTTEVGNFVGRASHRPVAGPACRPRQLLVAQQVAVSTTSRVRQGGQKLACRFKERASTPPDVAHVWYSDHTLHTTQPRSTTSYLKAFRYNVCETAADASPAGISSCSQDLSPDFSGRHLSLRTDAKSCSLQGLHNPAAREIDTNVSHRKSGL